MKVIFAAGGTGGHINPALAMADKLKEAYPDIKILFIGSPDGLESKLVTKAGYDFSAVKMAGIQRKLTPSNIAHNFKAVYYYLNAGGQVKKIFRSFSPDLVIGTGGYVTGTVLKTALKCKIKTAVHESNSLPGVSIKMISEKVDLVMLGSEDAKKHLGKMKKCIVTGNPLRNNIPIESKKAARERLGLPDCFTVLSAGGSQGAMRINEAVAELLSYEQKVGNINHIHGYGKHGKDTFMDKVREKGVDEKNPHFVLKEYIDNMYTCMCAADLIITRAGAMTLTEIMAIGRASVLVPYPYAAENHQYYNALTLQNAGAGRIINDKELTGERLVATVKELFEAPEDLSAMSQKAVQLGVKNAAELCLNGIKELMEV